MGLIHEFRTSLENPQTPLSYPAEWLLDIFNGGRTDSGIRVSEMTAIQVSAVFACVEIKAGAIGFLDLPIYERTIDKKGRATHRMAFEHALFELLEHQPNPEMSAFTLKKTVQAHRMLWGNGYVEIQRDRSGAVIGLWPRNPARIKPKRVTGAVQVLTGDGIKVMVEKGDMVYVTTEGLEMVSMDPENPSPSDMGSERVILPDDILHMPGLALDGRLGHSVVWLARQAVGMALATEKFGAKFFGNGAVGYGILEYPGTLDEPQREQLRRSVQEAYGGENVNRPMVLEAGLKYTPTSTKPNEAQFLETRNFAVTEIARFWGIPPHMLGLTEKTSRANTEQIGLEFLTFGLNPDLKCWQQEIRRKLLPTPTVGRNAGRVFVAKFDTSPLVMPDADTQRNYIASNIQWGVFSQNDARHFLGLNPIDDPAADAHYIQVNMQPLDVSYDLGHQAVDEGAQPEEDQPNPEPGEPGAGDRAAARLRHMNRFGSRLMSAYSRIFRDAFGRVSARSAVNQQAFNRALMPVLLSLADECDVQAAGDFGVECNSEEFQSSRFLADYLRGMHERSEREAWSSANGRATEICDRELLRAVRAIAIEVYRSAGTRAAKKKTEPVEV